MWKLKVLKRRAGTCLLFLSFKCTASAECVLEVAGSAAQPVAASARAAAGSATGLATGLARAAGSAPRSVLSKCSKLDSEFGFQMLAHAVKSTIRRSSLTSLAGRTYVCLSRLTTTS